MKYMELIQVKLPGELLAAAELSLEEPSLAAARLVALELFREGKVSLGRAAELCSTPLASFMEFAAGRGVAVIRYSAEDIEREIEAVEQPLS